MPDQHMTRRRFLRRSFGSASAAVGAPLILSSPLLGQEAPSNRLTVGCIGLGGQGSWDTRAFLNQPGAQIVAVCDVDRARAEKGRDMVEAHYRSKAPADTYSGYALYSDFRDVLARDDIDTVMIATPDHWHALITIAAVRAGKDVYCEKPLAYSVAEGRAVVNAVTQYGRVLQTGTQRRSARHIRHGCELVRNGRLGKLHTVRVGLPAGFQIRGGYGGLQPPAPVPGGFDYDMWLGPAPEEPYTPGRCHFNFRWILDYGEGYISDWGAHYLDVAQWGIGADDTGPRSVQASATFPSEGLYDAPIAFTIDYTYATGVKLICSTAETLGMRFEGTEGWLHLEKPGAAGIIAEPAGVLNSVIRPGEVRLRQSPGQHANFLDCVRTRRETTAPAEVGHRSASVCHVGMIAAILGRRLRWDPAAETFLNDPQANRLLARDMRSPWRV